MNRSAVQALSLSALILIASSPAGATSTSGLPVGGGDSSAAAQRMDLMPRGVKSIAIGQRAALVGINLPGAAGRWSPLGSTPEMEDTADNYNTDVSGYRTMAGRVQDFARDPNSGTIWAAVGSGGVWETPDGASNWRPISNALPTQSIGALAWTPAQGGLLVVGTGDSGMGYTGQGIFVTANSGKTWRRGSGAPAGSYVYHIAVDPTNPDVLYAATTHGLLRTTDAGASWVNVVLPTGCADLNDFHCFLANWVTDVTVRPAGPDGSGGGRVLAAVGWIRGPHQVKSSTESWAQAPGNGLYMSDSGAPGTFKASPMTGFTPQNQIGVTRLGMAAGPLQNHDIVWAMVSSATRNNGDVAGVPASVGAVPYGSTLDGVYVSTDFGQTWTLKARPEDLVNPRSDSSLVGQTTPTYAPGVQSWYDMWIQPDPTVQDTSGTPGRVLFGLEEIWESVNDVTTAVHPQWRSIGRYWAAGSCGGTNLPGSPPCPTQSPAKYTTHPDQHGALLFPRRGGGVTMLAGNDGGVYRQDVDENADFVNDNWNARNQGLHTLLPYMAVMSGDGTVWAGLQDNGEIKVEPDTGRQVYTHGGDGFFSAVDPANSNIAYEEYTYGDIQVTIDGGHTWTDINPNLTNAAFSTPFAMDPTDANHLITGGRNIVETVAGPKTTAPAVQPRNQSGQGPYSVAGDPAANWTEVFDLGPSDQGVDNQVSALAVRGAAAYVGFCGACYVASTRKFGFKSGLATNVAGAAGARKASSDGWHVASAKGLPQRILNGLAIDPADPKVVYVALGNYEFAVDYRPAGSLGDDTSRLGQGRVFKSMDGGENFTDISGDLPDAAANSVAVRGGQLIVGTDVGAFISSDRNGSRWALMGGNGLPIVPVLSVSLKPGDDNIMLAATYGRGLYTYNFPVAPAAPAASAAVKPGAPPAGDVAGAQSGQNGPPARPSHSVPGSSRGAGLASAPQSGTATAAGPSPAPIPPSTTAVVVPSPSPATSVQVQLNTGHQGGGGTGLPLAAFVLLAAAALAALSAAIRTRTLPIPIGLPRRRRRKFSPRR